MWSRGPLLPIVEPAAEGVGLRPEARPASRPELVVDGDAADAQQDGGDDADAQGRHRRPPGAAGGLTVGLPLRLEHVR